MRWRERGDRKQKKLQAMSRKKPKSMRLKIFLLQNGDFRVNPPRITPGRDFIGFDIINTHILHIHPGTGEDFDNFKMASKMAVNTLYVT